MDEKHKFLGNVEKFAKNLLRKLQKCIILAYLSKNLTNHALIFRAFGRKYKVLRNFEKILEIFDENSIEKLNFYIFWGKIVPKNRAFGKNIIFLQHFRVRGGGVEPPYPLE